MNFNSAEFLFFFPTTLLLYALVFNRRRARELVMLAASYFFYMSWNWKYAGLIALSTLVDYFVGLALGKCKGTVERRALLVTSLVVNLGVLGLFKYFNFFMDAGRQTLSVFGVDLGLFQHDLLLPVGISFYTFQTLSYTIDLYRQRIEPERDLVKFAVFVSFFPQLVAGPIVRASHFLPQMYKVPNVTSDRFASGAALIFRGLVKKIIIADLLASLAVDKVFANPGAFSSVDLLLALYGYTFQIYNDFSGYSDIAIGAARMMGFDLPLNFNRPYLAQNVREFWTRWHISLSTFLRDYLYIPLGGSRASKARTSVNLTITMLLGGLWHGAAVNFVLWGAYHGLLLMFFRGDGREPADRGVGGRLVRRVCCFHLVVIGWLFFRISDWDRLVLFVNGLLKCTTESVIEPLYVGVLFVAAITHFFPKTWVDSASDWFADRHMVIQAGAYVLAIYIFCGVSLEAPAFIYFQF